MYLKEFEGNAIFARYGINVPISSVIEGDLKNFNSESKSVLEKFLNANPGLNDFAVKAQLLRGHRGKSGAIVFADRGDLEKTITDLKDERFDGSDDYEIMVEEKVDMAEELYLSVTLDRFERCYKLIFSKNGGVDIEEIVDDANKPVFEINFRIADKNFVKDFFSLNCHLNEKLAGRLTDLAMKLLEIMENDDATLLEINPLALTKESDLVAVDSKVVIDDNALYRHKEFSALEGRGLSELEKEARDMGLAYVELEGDLAVIGNGAGLVMATLDAASYYGARAANFCDVGGGASRETMGEALKIVLSKKSVKKILINIFGGITHCDEIALGIIDQMHSGELKMPMCVRIVGTNENEAAMMLTKAGVKTFKSFEEAVKSVASL